MDINIIDVHSLTFAGNQLCVYFATYNYCFPPGNSNSNQPEGQWSFVNAPSGLFVHAPIHSPQTYLLGECP